MANIYDEFIIVEEKSAMEIAFPRFCPVKCDMAAYSCQHINSQFNDRTAFASLEFKMVNWSQNLYIKDISHSTNASGPLAQIVSWQWQGGAQRIEQTFTLNTGGTAEINCLVSPCIVIRILKKREVTENPCPLFSSPAGDDLTVHIGDYQVPVSASWLMAVSPVVKRMLSVEMKEKQQRTLNLSDLGITMEQFMQFLETINDHLRHGRTLPNPTNVLYLLALADYFQIDWLMERCEAHLINCVEIPLIERFLLIEPYRLKNLKNFFLSLHVDTLREFVLASYGQQLLSAQSVSQDLWFELIIRACHRQ